MLRNRGLLALLFSVLCLFPGTLAVAAEPVGVRDGRTEATAAGSCWEIKQRFPQSRTGTYWLLTPQMRAPQQFFCDQEMSGGGWVLIGRGREGWDRYPDGKGNPSALHSRNRSTEDFATVQLSTATINGLLGGTPVNSLADGMRVVRATNQRGTDWQTVDMRPTKMREWTWALASDDIATYRFNESFWQTSGAMSNQFGHDSAWYAMDLAMSHTRKYHMGFGYGRSAAGGNESPSSYLWSTNGLAPLPYAELYIRPEISSNNFEQIPDSGTPAIVDRALAANFAARTTWGVTGNLNGRKAEGNSPVQAFAEIGDTVYVGGNFTHAEQRSTGTKVPRTAVAAFDKTTGDLRESFSLTLDNQVKSLAALPDGRLLIGGDFKTANGERHVGTVAVDPNTGAIDPNWTLQVSSRLSSGIVSVTSLSVSGDFVYIGGNFTHLSSNRVNNVYARAAGRVRLDGNPDRSWNPEFNGTVVDIDTSPAGDRFYAAGYFTKSSGTHASNAAIISTEAGAPVVPGFEFVGSTPSRKNYQQAIDDSGELLFVGGSEHNLFGYDRHNLNRVSGSITKNIGGDLQAIATNGDIVYAGCHCSDSVYENSYTWPALNREWTKVDNIQWVGAWDAKTGAQLGQFSPYMLRSNNAGAWSLFLASDGALWVGGDFVGSRTSPNAAQWNGGWVRYPARDAVAPETPSSLRAGATTDTSVDLRWETVADAVSYDILRDDRVIATATTPSVTVPRGGDDRYFVRAVDAAGNRSASTPVFTPGEGGASPFLIDQGATWSYLYDQPEPTANWNRPEFDRTEWATGTAPIGYGGNNLATTITPPRGSSRPITTKFAHDFTVTDPKSFTEAVLEYVADDGAVVYVNGTEVSRTRMPDGRISPDTRATQAISATAAAAERTQVAIPSSLLVPGTNTVSVETHLNYRSSSSLTFDAMLRITNANPAPEQPPAPQNDVVIAERTEWRYWYDLAEPQTDGDLADWQTGVTPIGWGDPHAATPLDVPVAQRARTAYFARDLELSEVERKTLKLSVRADDGVVVKINGVEVGRKRVGDGAVGHNSYADKSVNLTTAIADPLEITVPADVLRNGQNRIVVETHLNYRSTPTMSFEMSATLVS